MKTGILILLFSLTLILSCTKSKSGFIEKAYSADYYKNLFTGEILDKNEFQKFRDSLMQMSYNLSRADSLNEEVAYNFTTHFHDFISGDSTIQEFNYSIRIGNEYIVRSGSLEKIGLSIPPKTFLTLDGENVQIGGEQSKPTLINLWFVGCTGCEQEKPALNRLKEKYGDKVNFISMTFDNEQRVNKYLNKKDFNYTHIVDVEDDYLKFIGTSPYPENIFINKKGTIVNIEGGLGSYEEDGKNLHYFESLIEKLL